MIAYLKKYLCYVLNITQLLFWMCFYFVFSMQFLLSWRWTVYAFVKIKKVLSCPALSCHVISCPVMFCSVLFGSVYHFIMTEVVLTGLWSSKKKTGLHVWRLTWNIVIDIAVRILTLYSCNVYKQKIYRIRGNNRYLEMYEFGRSCKIWIRLQQVLVLEHLVI